MKKTKTWIITCIYLQLLLICFGSPCSNPVTDAVNDIEKLVGNLPSDYIMRLKRVPVKDHLAKHCWFYVMLHEVSYRLEELLSKFSKTSQNYHILDNLSLILREIRFCVKLNEQEEFVEEYLETIPEGHVNPSEFFKYVNNTINLFKDINNTHYIDTCMVPTDGPEEGDNVTKGNTQYASSKLKNSSKIGPLEQAPFSNSPSLPWPSIASITLACLVIGFLFGVMCWKVKHQRGQAENEVPEIHIDQTEANELNNMLQQTATNVSVI
ncbi:kit ligand [Pseudophryne corroboree]|uniref:kit ligand n=1 Tax=Pseudophryne corroboree TaxID=495146 RepID=UPI003081D51F